jgi:hypothetical protein
MRDHDSSFGKYFRLLILFGLFFVVSFFIIHRGILTEKITSESIKILNYNQNDKSFYRKIDSEKHLLYVLGGQSCLKQKYVVAADLFYKGYTKKIMVLSVPGITEYNASLDRNLTNDEWSIKQLKSLGMLQKDIEFVYIPDNYFGTLSEAKTIDEFAIKREMKRIILICSSYHSKKGLVIFFSFFEKNRC